MMEKQKGTIINVGSVASFFSAPFMGVYSGSKAAVESVSQALRNEMRPYGIRVVYCAPGGHTYGSCTAHQVGYTGRALRTKGTGRRAADAWNYTRPLDGP